MKRLSLFILCLLLCCAPALAADIPEPTEDFYVYDGAGVLDYEAEGHIVFCNDELDAACGAQVVFVTVGTVGSSAIDDYARELFNRWEIGDGRTQNGVLVLMAIDDDNYYALPGAGLDLELGAGTLKQYLDEYLEPDFADRDYDAGARKLFDALFERVADICGADVSLADGDKRFEAYLATEDGSREYEERRAAQEDPATAGGCAGGGCAMLTLGCAGCGGSCGAGILLLVLMLVLVGLGGGFGYRRYRRYHPPVHPRPPRPRGWFWGGPRPGSAPRPPRAPKAPKPPRTPRSGGFGGGFFGGGGSPARSGGAGRTRSFGGGRRSGGFGGGRRGGGGGTRGGGIGRGR